MNVIVIHDRYNSDLYKEITALYELDYPIIEPTYTDDMFTNAMLDIALIRQTMEGYFKYVDEGGEPLTMLAIPIPFINLSMKDNTIATSMFKIVSVQMLSIIKDLSVRVYHIYSGVGGVTSDTTYLKINPNTIQHNHVIVRQLIDSWLNDSKAAKKTIARSEIVELLLDQPKFKPSRMANNEMGVPKETLDTVAGVFEGAGYLVIDDITVKECDK